MHPAPPPPVGRLLDLAGKVALITGGGGGIGRAIVERCAEAGAAVAIHYHTRPDPAHELAQRIVAAGGRAVALPGDVASAGDVAQLVAATVAQLGRLDVLVNNAARQTLASLLEMSPEEWDGMLATNLRGVFLGTQAAARQMIAQGTGGAIINIASIGGEQPAPNHSHYNTTKSGVLMHTRAAAAELGRHGIRVNAVAPGLIWREGLEDAWPDGVARWLHAVPLGRLGTPEDVADACLFLASSAARWVTGVSLRVDGGVMSSPIY